MKKFLVAIMLVAMLVSVFAFTACKPDEIKPFVDESYTLVVPDGAPALAIANFPTFSSAYSITRISTDKAKYGITRKVVSSTLIQAEAVKPDVDMAIVPANMASIIFNKNGGYKILAVVTNGNLYMTSSIPCEVDSLQGIVGKLVYSIGQNSVPDMIFRTLLADAGIEYKVGEDAKEGQVTINYCGDGQAVIGKLGAAKSKGELAFGIYGEPAVTKSKANGFQEVFDLQALWSANGEGEQSGYAQAVLIARDKVCEDSEFVSKVLDLFAFNDSSILQDSAKAVENIKAIYPSSSLQVGMTLDVIKRCNIKTVPTSTQEGRMYYENTLKAVMAIDANLIGGKLPSDDFYIAK